MIQRRNFILIIVCCLIGALGTISYASLEKNDAKYLKGSSLTAIKYLQDEQYDEAIVEYKKVLAQNPDNLHDRLGYAQALAGNTLYERAIAEYELILNKGPRHKEAIKALGILLEKMGDYAEAIALYEKATETSPDDVQLTLTLARMYDEESRIDEAIRLYKQIIEQAPKNAEAYLGLGNMYYDKVDYQQSEYYFTKAKVFARNDNRIDYGLACIKFRQEEYLKALELLEKAKQNNPLDIDAEQLLAESYLKDKQYEKAIELFNVVLGMDPEDDQVRLDLAGIYLNTAQYKEAVSVLEKIADEEPVIYPKNMMLAFAHGAQGDMPGFWKHVKKIQLAAIAIVIVSIILLSLAIGAIGLLFLFAYYAGKSIKDNTLLFSHVRWTLKESLLVCAILGILPILVGIFIGGFFYKNWFLVFAQAEVVSNNAVNVAICAQIISVVLLCGYIMYLVLVKNRQNLQDIGFKAVKIGRLIRLSLTAVGSILLFNVCYFYLFFAITGHSPEGQFISKVISSSKTASQITPLFLFVVILGPLAEEMIFRGFIFSSLRRYSGIKVAVIISAILFGAFHLQITLLLPIAFMGIVFACLFERTRSLYPAMFVHLIWNLVAFSAAFFMK
ncbi:MAG: tetratricopeptide repeat protein [PVC group bacterium]|nr:tetratricopeptide repeat protein [PVC group bacterium]